LLAVICIFFGAKDIEQKLLVFGAWNTAFIQLFFFFFFSSLSFSFLVGFRTGLCSFFSGYYIA